MKTSVNTTRRRINIMLPEETLQSIDTIASKGSRSSLINEAVQSYIQQVSKKKMWQRVRDGAIARSQRDLKIVQEWFS